jgi:hypothetical protein
MSYFLNKYVFNGAGTLALLALFIAAGCVLSRRNFTAEGGRVTGYYSLAVSLKANGVLAYPGSPATPTAYRAPLYPVFLSLFAGEDAAAMRAAFLAQLFVFALTVLLVWAAAALAAGSRTVALAAAGLYALHPQAAAGAASFEVEFFYGFLLAAAAAAMALAAVKQAGFKYWALAFGFAGIAISCKSPMAGFPALLAAWLCCGRAGGAGLKRKLPLLLLLSCLAIVPWTARNAKHFRAFIPFERGAALCNIYSAGAGLPGTCLPSVAAKLYAREGRGELYAPGTTALALLKAIAVRPGNYLKGFAKRVPLVFGTFPFLFISAAAGLWLNRKNEGMLALGLLTAYFAAVSLLFSFEPRYLVPVLPVLSVLAAAPAGRLFAFLHSPAKLPDAGPAAKAVLAAAACVILPVYALSVRLLAAETLKPGLKPQGADAVETLVPVLRGGHPAELAAYHNQKGVLKIFSGEHRPAQQEFEAAIKADPRYADPYLNLAFALRALGEPAAALRACQSAEENSRPPAGAGAYSGTMLAEILKCQEISMGSLGRKKAARALAARRIALENKIAAELGER